MTRRRLLASVSALASMTGLAFSGIGRYLPSFVAPAEAQTPPDGGVPFSRTWLLDEARRLAEQPANDSVPKLPESLRDLSYEQYRDIRFKPEATVWFGENRGFTLDLLPAGFLFDHPVDLFVVSDGRSVPLTAGGASFDFGPLVAGRSVPQVMPLSGFRIRFPLNAPDRMDEVMVFQGASYFRAVGRNQLYGLSARGIALATGDPRGEEFPSFTRFWIERPEPNASVLVMHALLESASVTGAYRFTIRPGPATTVDVEMTLFPRVDLDHVGLGPLTSMFLFDSSNRGRFDDYRPAVHDSDGLEIWTGAGEWIWRPLANPSTLQLSAFVDRNPHGFGLVQRKRRFEDFGDLESLYERRPSAWVEPIGDWGRGAVQLVEIPSDKEVHDNIVAFWRPKDMIAAKSEYAIAYRIHWGANVPNPPDLAWVVATRTGLAPVSERRLFVVDFQSAAPLPANVRPELWASAGKLFGLAGHVLPTPNGYRVSFELDPAGAPLSELRLVLTDGTKQLSETWLYRWTA